AIDGRVEIRLEAELMVERRAGIMAGEIPIAVMNEVAERRLVGRRGDLDGEAVFVIEAEADARIEIAGESLLAIGGRIVEADGAAIRCRPAGPEALVESPEAAMLVIAAVIAAQLMGDAVEGEEATGDAVAVAPADGAHIAARREIGLGIR